MKKKLLYIVLLCILFIYGFSIGFYKIFPFQQLQALKHYIEFNTGNFETREAAVAEENADVLDTFLNRLLIKKIRVPGYTGHGGGLSINGEFLYLVTNKGSVQVYNSHTLRRTDSSISDVPMNFSGLIQSGHPYRNSFKINWFRVNGVLTEQSDSSRHRLYISHNAYDSERDCITHNISRTELNLAGNSVNQTDNWEIIFTASPCIDPEPDSLQAAALYPGHISGGSMVHFDNNYLLISIGDYNRHGIDGAEEYAMDISNPYGKFILINKQSGDWSVFASGSRNASALFIDKNTNIWAVENGPAGGDELNLITDGGNYGWPHVSYGLWYDPEYKLPGGKPDGTHPEFNKPVFSWVPSVAPSSLTKIEGDKFELWNGDLIVGTMRDQSLHRLRLNENNGVVYDERIPFGHRIRDITTLPDEKILLLTDDGYLIVIEDGGPVFQDMDSETEKLISELNDLGSLSDDAGIEEKTVVFEDRSRAVYEQYCASCHNLNPVNQIGPHLNNLFNREIGEVEDFNYSATLQADPRRWNSQLLQSFLENPGKEFEGTQMQKINLASEDIELLIQYLQAESGNE